MYGCIPLCVIESSWNARRNIDSKSVFHNFISQLPSVVVCCGLRLGVDYFQSVWARLSVLVVKFSLSKASLISQNKRRPLFSFWKKLSSCSWRHYQHVRCYCSLKTVVVNMISQPMIVAVVGAAVSSSLLSLISLLLFYSQCDRFSLLQLFLSTSLLAKLELLSCLSLEKPLAESAYPPKPFLDSVWPTLTL